MHVLTRRSFFEYIVVDDGEKLHMDKSFVCKILSHEKIVLKMTYEKNLTLNNLVHAFDIWKNLVSSLLLRKAEFILVFKFDKFVLTKSEMLVGKGYIRDILFKLNVMTIEINKAINSI
jgi:hypothetical protein